MPRFEPFAGIRYSSALPLRQVTSPPYDVIDGAERERLAASHPNNAVLVDCPVGDLGTASSGAGADAGDCYEQAGDAFRRWRAEGVLVTDERPSFTVYRMTAEGRSTTGVLGALTLERPGEGDVLPHERTTPKAKSDRLDLLRATRANLSPIWGLSMAAGLSALLDPPGEPVGDFTDDGVRHQAWRIDDPERLAAITATVAGAPVVIADGHHRYETCLAYRDEVGDAVPGAAATLCFVVELAEDQLAVRPIHRVVHGGDVAGALAAAYRLDAGGAGRPALVTEEATYRLRPLVDDGTLDTVRLDAALAGFDVTYQHDADAVVEAVHAGKADAGVLLEGVTVEQIAAVAEARDRMPPKTTFFWPKPRTGIVFRSLEMPA